MTASKDSAKITNKDATGSYALVNGLNMYYEMHGTGKPIVLLHGAFSAIGTSFGAVLPGLAETRQVIGVELQGHGRTADIDRPVTLEQMADDVAALLQYLKIEKADILGYSMGAGVAMHLTLRHPDLVRKLIVVSLSSNNGGFYPGFMEGMENIKIEQMAGSPWQLEYASIAPNPENWSILFEKIKGLNANVRDTPNGDIQSIKSPVMVIIGDSDIVQPEHAVGMFRLLGGGVIGDMVGMPASQLAVLPSTPHSRIMERASWIVPMVSEFLGD